MAEKLVQLLKQKFPSAVVESHSQHGDDTVVVLPANWLQVARFLRDDPACRMEMLVDLCGVDWLDREPRFEVVVHLHSLTHGHRLRLKTRVGDREGEGAVVDSLTAVWPGANWFERETWDLMGIHFQGHPDMRRILMYEEFEGHPLRKDYAASKTQPLVPYRDVPNTEKLPPFGDDEGMSFGRKSYELENNPNTREPS
jgi:NADH-quinone oxidoreductase subunit C